MEEYRNTYSYTHTHTQLFYWKPIIQKKIIRLMYLSSEIYIQLVTQTAYLANECSLASLSINYRSQYLKPLKHPS